MNKTEYIIKVTNDWNDNARWNGIVRPYLAEDIWNVKGLFHFDFSLSKFLAEKLWNLLGNNDYIHSLGCVTGNQATQCAKAGLKSIYLSGWQVAGDQNLSYETYPDQSLYPSNSAPALMRRINKALQRAHQIEWSETNGNSKTDYFLPTVADAEAGFGGNLNIFELTKQFIEAGVAAIHAEDQVASLKKCGHLSGKILVPTNEHIQKLIAIRLAADLYETPILIIARTDAKSAQGICSDIDDRDRPFLTGERTTEGFYKLNSGIEMAINRGLSFAPYCDMLWMEDNSPSIENAKKFADAIHEKYPDKLLALNCSPSFNWEKYLSEDEILSFQNELGKIGYRYLFVTLAGWHSLNNSMFELARDYAQRGMAAYSELQQQEFKNQKDGYTAVKHQREVGTSYFDKISEIISSGQSSTAALKGSTESEQF